MSIRRQLETLERKMAPWVVAPPPPDIPGDDGDHWWRSDPNFGRLTDALAALVHYVKGVTLDEETGRPNLNQPIDVFRLVVNVTEPLVQLGGDSLDVGQAVEKLFEKYIWLRPLANALGALLAWVLPRAKAGDPDLQAFMTLLHLPGYWYAPDEPELLAALRGEASIPAELLRAVHMGLATIQPGGLEDARKSTVLPTGRAMLAAKTAASLKAERLAGDSKVFWRRHYAEQGAA